MVAALLLYVKKGEELDSFDDSIRESQEEKRRGADKAAELLGQVKSTLRLEPTSPKQGITASAKTSSTLNAAVAVESTVHGKGDRLRILNVWKKRSVILTPKSLYFQTLQLKRQR
jgi:hypothetical protein